MTRAAALPTKMATGSSPESRNASRLSLTDSTVNDRCTARIAVNTTVTQNNPAVKVRSVALSPSRANPNNTSTVTANGAICVSPTRDRRSMRRSLPVTSVISPHIGHPRHSGLAHAGYLGAAVRLGSAVGHHHAAGDGDRTGCHGAGSLELVRGDDDRGSPGRCVTNDLVD